MKSLLIAMVMASAAGAASAQDAGIGRREFLAPTLHADADPRPLPPGAHPIGFTVGPAAGFIRTRDADDGTWFGGVQARLRVMPYLAAEASITFHQDDFADGDVTVTQYPVQLSGLLYPLGGGPAQPYLVAGGGWYYTRIDFSGTLSAFDDDTEHVVGYHIGVGIDVVLTPQITLSADVRQIFIDPDFDNAEDEEFDFVQVGLGVSFGW